MTELLRKGIVAARAGRRDEARKLLLSVVEADERSEQGWLWLSGVVDDPADIRTCLLNVLDINPDNQHAKKGLAWVEQRYGPAKPALAPEPPTAPEPAREEADLQRAVGTSYTRTTLGLRPVAAPPEEPPAAKRAPAQPTERFRGALPGAPAPLESVAPPPASGVATMPARPPRPAPEPTALYTPIVPPQPTPPVDAAAASIPETNPCPYCGAPTATTLQRCTQCRNGLMVRANPAEHRSLALLVLGGIWRASAVLWLVLAGLQADLLLSRGALAGQTNALARGLGAALLAALFSFFVAGGLLRRERWAYFANMLLVAINGFVALGLAIFGAAFVVFLRAGAQHTPFVQNASAIVTIALILTLLAFVLAPIALTILSYRDFFGSWTRFLPTVADADHVEHYNNGVAYKNRGMWYMAAQEWERATSKKPRDASYLHALGLAYAQLKRFEQARAALDRAIQAAPDNAKIKESRALVDRMAA